MPESESAEAESGSETPPLPVGAQISDRIGGYVYGSIGVLVTLGSLGAGPGKSSCASRSESHTLLPALEHPVDIVSSGGLQARDRAISAEAIDL
jgi:hypothetical protein